MLLEIAKKIHDDIFTKMSESSFTIFLIGAAQKDRFSIRETLRKELTRFRYLHDFNFYYPEELFAELILSKAKFDLLSLENMLAESVHAVVIILESPGAIAELGAFANHPNLRNKLVVIVDKKYRKARSFIRLGPVRYLEKKTNSKVIFHDLAEPNFGKLAFETRKAVKDISRNSVVEASIKNPISAQFFIMTCIFIMEQISIELLNNIIHYVYTLQTPEVEAIVQSSLNILLKQKDISLNNGNYDLTDNGYRRIMFKLGSQGRETYDLIDELRVKIMNVKLRRRTFSREGVH